MVSVLQTVLTLGLAAQLLIVLTLCPETVHGDNSVVAETSQDRTDRVRHKRAPGWGKRDGEMEAFEDDGQEDLMDSADVTGLDKRAPGWGKRDFEADKRAPGWGKRAPGWGKRAPGWGKRAPGWGKRAPGWGKRAPGWGKRSEYGSGSLDLEKRAPGWGKRAPGWGKRAPGWGKRAGFEDSDVCQVLREEADLFVTKAMEEQIERDAPCMGKLCDRACRSRVVLCDASVSVTTGCTVPTGGRNPTCAERRRQPAYRRLKTANPTCAERRKSYRQRGHAVSQRGATISDAVRKRGRWGAGCPEVRAGVR